MLVVLVFVVLVVSLCWDVLVHLCYINNNATNAEGLREFNALFPGNNKQHQQQYEQHQTNN